MAHSSSREDDGGLDLKKQIKGGIQPRNNKRSCSLMGTCDQYTIDHLNKLLFNGRSCNMVSLRVEINPESLMDIRFLL